MAYDQFSSKVAEYLKADPNHLRFTTVSTAGKPKQAIKYNANSTLNNILFPGPYNYSASATQRNDAMFYEVLDMSLKELEQRKPVKVTWLPEGLSKEEEHTLMVPKNAQVSDLLEALQKKAGISDELMQKSRAYEAHMHKFHKSLPPDHSIMSLYDYTQIFVAPFPEEESPKKIAVFHFDKEPSKPHGVPFQFSLKEGEPFSETKQRLSDFTKIKGKQLDKIKFGLVSRSQYSKPEAIEDDEALWDIVTQRDDVSLGLDHPAKARTLWGKTDSIFIR